MPDPTFDLNNPPEENVPVVHDEEPKIKPTSSLAFMIKSMGGGKAVSALFGMLLLAGGVGAGIVLVTQPQLLEQRAQEVTYTTCGTPGTQGTCQSNYLCSSTGNCEPKTGVGNCANNTGNCYVTTSIGIEETAGADGIRSVCDPGGHWTTCEVGYMCSNYDCVPSTTTTKTPGPSSPPSNAPVVTPTPSPTPLPTPSPSPTPTASPTPSPTPMAACLGTTMYTPAWTSISANEFYNLPAGGQVYFCTQGTTNSGTFDMARFTINNVLRPDVTFVGPGGVGFCDLYTIPSNTYTFTVQGEIHHTTLGWR